MTLLCATVYAQIPPIPPAAQRSIERIIGTAGTYAANESVRKIRIPRTDIALNLQGQRVTSGLPIESWVAFSPDVRGGGLMMGELQLHADQLQRVLKALRARRLDLISIRNQTIAEHPQLVFVRFAGSGRATDLAKAVRYALDVQVGTIKPAA